MVNDFFYYFCSKSFYEQMNELSRLKERVDIAIEIGESYYREFKSAFERKPASKTSREVKDVCYDIAKTLVAFANADGGNCLSELKTTIRLPACHTLMKNSDFEKTKIESPNKSFIVTFFNKK